VWHLKWELEYLRCVRANRNLHAIASSSTIAAHTASITSKSEGPAQAHLLAAGVKVPSFADGRSTSTALNQLRRKQSGIDRYTTSFNSQFR